MHMTQLSMIIVFASSFTCFHHSVSAPSGLMINHWDYIKEKHVFCGPSKSKNTRKTTQNNILKAKRKVIQKAPCDKKKEDHCQFQIAPKELVKSQSISKLPG